MNIRRVSVGRPAFGLIRHVPQLEEKPARRGVQT